MLEGKTAVRHTMLKSIYLTKAMIELARNYVPTITG